MKLDLKFRQMDYSEEIADYVQERFAKLGKFEWKPITVHVTFSAERHNCLADVYVHGRDLTVRARAKSGTYFDAIDLVVNKITKQLARKKGRVKDHTSTPPWRITG